MIVFRVEHREGSFQKNSFRAPSAKRENCEMRRRVRRKNFLSSRDGKKTLLYNVGT
jgi:hypothetical protein